MNYKAFFAQVTEKFGEHIEHHIFFPDQESAVSFFSSLSFVKKTPQGPSVPLYFKALLEECSDGSFLCIAGKLSIEENYEIRKKVISEGFKAKFYTFGESQAPIAEAVNELLKSEDAQSLPALQYRPDQPKTNFR